jgi:Uncharacterized protein conserved in bacteria (DUF2325)
MASHLSHMLTTSLLQPAPIAARLVRSELILKGGPDGADRAPGERGQEGTAAVATRRTRLWEFDHSLHCSIIGTCLTTAELRSILVKLKVAGGATEHELHGFAVTVASRREGGAKFLQKALDRRHQTAITRYAKAKDPSELSALWAESLKQGDIPGAYWAVLTHPATTEDLVKRVFGDVHMLSHLVGAANRADIRRLRQLEQDNAAVAAKVERQQRQLREGFTARDETIRRLNAMLASQVRPHAQPHQDVERDPHVRQDAELAATEVIRDLNERLARETARREGGDQRLRELSARLGENEAALRASRQECRSALQELQSVEGHLAAAVRPDAGAFADGLQLAGVTLLYVGGRAHQIPQLRALVERIGARLLHHDGGIEHGATLLPGLVSRADRVLFPIDCVSHDAVAMIKRLCRQTGKSYTPLRTASLACLLAALVRMEGPIHA